VPSEADDFFDDPLGIAVKWEDREAPPAAPAPDAAAPAPEGAKR
jgi:hypothetical protein